MVVPVLALLLLSVFDYVHSLEFAVTGRHYARHLNKRLERRDDEVIQVDNPEANTAYFANLTVGGTQFEALIDTGSSDLWLQKPVPNAQDTTFTSGVQYAVGNVRGPVKLAQVKFSGYTVDQQAFISLPTDSATDVSDSDGLIGLGPSSSSSIRHDMGDKSIGDPLIDNIFRQDLNSPNFITALLSRQSDQGVSVDGKFSIGKVASGLEQITQMPQLPVVTLHGSSSINQHWSSLVDAIIGPNGRSIPIQSTANGVPKGQFAAVYDTGFTYPQVPKYISDAIYQQIPGAQFDFSSQFWTMPCDQEVNITFVIGGRDYPIHPWDATMPNEGDKTICRGSFQPILTSTDSLFDLILGMAFLRNAYILINFGDFIDGNPAKQGDPYIQLFSVTDKASAHHDFVQSRLNGVDTTSSQTRLPLPPINLAEIAPPNINNNQDGDKVKKFFAKNWPYLAAGGGALAVLIIGGCIWSTVRSRRARYRRIDGRVW